MIGSQVEPANSRVLNSSEFAQQACRYMMPNRTQSRFQLDGKVALVTVASKGIGEAMAQDWGAANIRVNAICPGLLKTRFSEALWSDRDSHEHFIGYLPLGRIGEPEDLAGLAVYLASDTSVYCTGGAYRVDGDYFAS